MTLSKEVEPLWEYGWWAKQEMLKTGKCSPHKERRKGIDGFEFAKFIEAHLSGWQKETRKWNGIG